MWLKINSIICVEGDCGEIRRIKFYPPDNGRYLDGHVFLNLSIGIHRQCEEKCLLESECVSVNIGPPSNDKFVCELSNSDHVQHRQDLKLRRDWIYRGIEVGTTNTFVIVMLVIYDNDDDRADRDFGDELKAKFS